MNLSTSFAIILFSLFSIISSSGIPTSGLRQELIESIKEIQLYGEPKEFDSSVRDLLAQLEKFQMNAPKTIQLDWDAAEVTASSEIKSVCIVVSSFEGMYINSGIGTAYYALANLLVSQGHKVTVIYTRDEPTVGGSWADWVAHHKASGISLLSLPPTSVPLSMSALQATSLRVYRYLTALPVFDIVHFADFEGHGFYPTLAKKVTNQFSTTSFIVGLHGPTRWILEANQARIPVDESEIDIDWMERMSVENADAVWTPSAYMASWMSVQGWTLPSSVHMLPLAPGPEFRDFVAPVSTTVQPTEFVYFGRLEVRKGLILFCDALDLFSKIYHTLNQDITITFLGRSGLVNGVEGSEYVSQRAGKWPFKVRMNNNASRKQALNYLADSTASRVAIIPSLSDNAPYTIFECLYAGIPFLASNVPSISPLFADDSSRTAHLFEVKPHHIVSKMASAVRNGITSATPAFTIKQAESVWTSFYAKVQPKTPVAVAEDAPLVSVVITHHNRAELVQQAIASVESQTYSEIEVVLVDDGSTEESALSYLDSIESHFQEKNWKIIRSSNQYLGAARNAGAKVAKGKYLLFLDDDNVFVPTAVATYVLAAKLSGAGIVTAGHAVFEGASAPSAETTTRHWMPLGASLTAGLFKNTFGDANFFVEKSKFELVGGFTEDKGVGLEEHEFFAKSVFSGTDLEVVPEILLYYRQHSQENQMLYNTDVRLGEARRLRPYISALGEQTKPEEESHQSSRRSLVNLVARNAVSPRAAVCNTTVTAVTPSEGPWVGGNIVVITGTGLSCGSGPSAVTIDAVACSAVQVLNDTAVACTVPRSVRTTVYVQVDVAVTVSGVAYTLSGQYRYLPTPAPTLAGSGLSADGVLTVSFSVPTNEAVSKKRTDALCAALFDAAAQDKLGSTTHCSFTDESTLSVALGYDASVSSGDTLVIPEGVILGAGPNGAPNAKISIVVTTSAAPIKPTVFINSPTVVGKCEGITLNATGSIGAGGRKFTKVTWGLNETMNSNSASNTAILAALASASSDRSLVVVLPAHIIVAGGSYRFTLELTNWFASSDHSELIVRKATTPVPIVSIGGDSVRTIYKETALSFSGAYSGMACNETYGPALLVWSISPSPAGVVGSSSTTFNIPAYTLTAGQTYTVTLTVTDQDSSESNNATVQIIVSAHPIFAQIIGGGRQYGTTDNITLSASNSSDPDNLGPLSYTWSCQVKTTAAACPITFTSDADQTFAGSSLGIGVFTITVTVNGALSRTASVSTDITVTALPYLKIHINQAFSTYAVADQIILYGVIDNTNVASSGITWSWTTTATVSNTAYPQGTTSANLVIAAGSLKSGVSYTYTLTATDSVSGITGVATATFSIIQSLPPMTTVCADTRGAQATYASNFYFSFGERWQYASGVNTFQISYAFEGAQVYYPAAAEGQLYNMTLKLPSGKLNVLGKAVSSTGTVSTFTCSVNVAAGDLNVISRDALNATSMYDLAHAAFSIYNSKIATSVETDLFSARQSTLTRALYMLSSGRTLTADELKLLSGFMEVLVNFKNGQFNSQEIIGAGTLSYSALIQAGSNTLTTQQQLEAVNSVQNVLEFLKTQISRATAGADRARSIVPQAATATQYDSSQLQDAISAQTASEIDNPWAGVTSLAEAVQAIATTSSVAKAALVNVLPLGVITTLFSSSDIKTYYKDAPSVIDGNGASLGVNSTVMISSGTVPTSVLGQSVATVLYVEAKDSLYELPQGFLLASSVMSVSALDSSNTNFNLSSNNVIVVIPDSVLNTNNGSNTCAMYVDGNWTSSGVSTDRSTTNSTVCTFPKFATFALLNSPSGSATSAEAVVTTGPNSNSPVDDGGLSGGAIAGIVIGGVVLVAVIAVGSAIGVKKHRDNAAIATNRPGLRSGDTGFGGIAIDPPLDPIFIPAHMGPVYVPPANGSAGPTYVGNVSPIIYGTFQQPAPAVEQQAAAPPQRRGQQINENDFSSDSESSDGY